jgi:hypothetical protein
MQIMLVCKANSEAYVVPHELRGRSRVLLAKVSSYDMHVSSSSYDMHVSSSSYELRGRSRVLLAKVSFDVLLMCC